jgi:hypothetical protein
MGGNPNFAGESIRKQIDPANVCGTEWHRISEIALKIALLRSTATTRAAPVTERPEETAKQSGPIARLKASNYSDGTLKKWTQ